MEDEAPSKTEAEDILNFFFQRKLDLAFHDNSHKMSNLIFSEKYKKKKKNDVCCNFA